MPSEKEHKVFLTLLRAGLWEKETDSDSLFLISGEIWRKVFSLALQQTVTGVVYRGLNYLPDNFLPPEDLLCRWTVEIDKIERYSRKMNETVHRVCAFFDLHGLHPVLLKGQGVAGMYEYPLLRETGDIDLYFPDEIERIHAEQLVREKGISIDRLPDGSVSYFWNGVEIEHHPRLVDLHNPFLRTYLKTVEREKGYVVQTTECTAGTNIMIPSPELNLLLLNSHIMKHAMGKGIGLRQLCDLARAYCNLHDSFDGNEIKEIYRRAGLGRWSRLLHSFLVTVLGMPESYLPYKEKHMSCNALLKIIMSGGNFGQYKDGHRREMQSTWRRKFHTAASFMQNAGFSCRYAPEEFFWTVATLLKGQIKC